MADEDTPALDPSQAYAALQAYADRYGRLPLLLLAHVAVPQSFRADLVNLTKVNFLPEAGDDLMVDADVLFSPLVEPQGAGFYRLDREVRYQCMILLDAVYRHGPERRRTAVARFLLAYLDDLDRRPQSSEDPLLVEYLETERHLAAAIIDPAGAAERIARALKSFTEQKTRTRVHFTEMADALSVPLAGYPELLAYVRGVGALQSGNEKEAGRLLARVGSKSIKIGDVDLQPAIEGQRDTRRTSAPATPLAHPSREPSPPDRDISPQMQRDTDHRTSIFVSYSVNDDQPMPPAEQGWVTSMLRDLERALDTLLGGRRTYSIVGDNLPQIRDNWFEDHLAGQARRSDLLIMIMSPSWLARAFCRREFDWFIEGHSDSLAGRLFVIEPTPVDRDQEIPELVRELVWYRFYRRDENHGTAFTLRRFPYSEEREYFAKIHDLASDIRRRLESTDGESAGPRESSAPTLFLAEVTDDLEMLRDGLRRYLVQYGVEVAPTTTHRLERSEFEQSMKRDLAKSALFVQLLGPFSGRRPPDVPEGFVQLQYDLAQHAGVPILQWRNPEIDVANVADWSLRKLLELETVHVAPFEEFKRTVRDRFRRLLEPTPTAKPLASRVPFVFIDAGREDRASAEEIGKGMDERFAWAMPISFAGKGRAAEEVRQDLEESLIDADGIVIVYGVVPPSWVRSQLRLCQKLSPRRRRPLRLLALVLAPPLPKPPIPIGLPGLLTIEIDALLPVLEQRLLA